MWGSIRSDVVLAHVGWAQRVEFVMFECNHVTQVESIITSNAHVACWRVCQQYGVVSISKKGMGMEERDIVQDARPGYRVRPVNFEIGWDVHFDCHRVLYFVWVTVRPNVNRPDHPVKCMHESVIHHGEDQNGVVQLEKCIVCR